MQSTASWQHKILQINMNSQEIIDKLSKKYPEKNIIKNDKASPTQITCEIEPTSDHPEYSIAIVVVDDVPVHHHNKSTELYEILEGEADVTVDGTKIHLYTEEKLTIPPGSSHSVIGNSTWIKISSFPGWTIADHIEV